MIDNKKTKILMMGSAVYMGLIGMAASFTPEELLASTGASPGPVAVLVFKIVGALYVGFAALNWLGKANIIGGIYSRPVTVGNFAHFFIAAIVLIKAGALFHSVIYWVAIVINAGFAGCFGYLLFGSRGDSK